MASNVETGLVRHGGNVPECSPTLPPSAAITSASSRSAVDTEWSWTHTTTTSAAETASSARGRHTRVERLERFAPRRRTVPHHRRSASGDERPRRRRPQKPRPNTPTRSIPPLGPPARIRTGSIRPDRRRTQTTPGRPIRRAAPAGTGRHPVRSRPPPPSPGRAVTGGRPASRRLRERRVRPGTAPSPRGRLCGRGDRHS